MALTLKLFVHYGPACTYVVAIGEAVQMINIRQHRGIREGREYLYTRVTP